MPNNARVGCVSVTAKAALVFGHQRLAHLCLGWQTIVSLYALAKMGNPRGLLAIFIIPIIFFISLMFLFTSTVSVPLAILLHSWICREVGTVEQAVRYSYLQSQLRGF